VKRRQLLSAGVGLLAVAAAGCTDDAEPTDDTDATDGAGTETPGGDASTAEPTATSTDTADLDLREANVTGVGVEEREDGYPFSVTLFHDDEGEDGYANWWQVETLDGERLGRRELSHSHGTREFTRSETIPVPDDVECVVVRGHDQTHGYGGQAALVGVASGTTRLVRQGSDPASFDASDCP